MIRINNTLRINNTECAAPLITFSRFLLLLLLLLQLVGRILTLTEPLPESAIVQVTNHPRQQMGALRRRAACIAHSRSTLMPRPCTVPSNPPLDAHLLLHSINLTCMSLRNKPVKAVKPEPNIHATFSLRCESESPPFYVHKFAAWLCLIVCVCIALVLLRVRKSLIYDIFNSRIKSFFPSDSHVQLAARLMDYLPGSRAFQLILSFSVISLTVISSVYFATWLLFVCQRRSQAPVKVPPTLPYAIPFIGSAISFALNPHRCITQSRSVSSRYIIECLAHANP